MSNEPRPPMTLRELMESEMEDIAGILKAACPPKVGFLIMFFDTDQDATADHWMTYASTGRRSDVVKMIRELADKLAEQPRPA